MSCDACESGKYAALGSAACSVCSAGEAEILIGMTVGCAPCEEGTYSPLGIYCMTCPAGSYTADQVNCNPCDAGTYSATDGATSCTACPPGRHQPASGQTECEICEPGRVASASGQATCDQCDAGRFSAAPGASTCVDCAPGWHQAASGRSECEECAPGRFANGTRQTACENCRQFGEGRTSAAGSAVCDMCEADYYYDGGECIKCPWSATCPANSTLGSPWVVDEGFYRFSMDTPAIYRCKRNDGCVGGEGSGDALCADNHHGPLCHLCDEGYYMEHVLRTCLECKSRPSVFLTVAFGMMMLVAIGLVVLIAWVTWRSLSTSGASAWPAVLERGCGDDWRLVRLLRWLKVHCGDFLTSSCFLSVWHSLAVLFCVEINQCVGCTR